MFFDNCGNLYIKKNENIYQLNIDKDENIVGELTKPNIGIKIDINPLFSVDEYFCYNIEDVLNNIDTQTDFDETDAYDYMTIGDTMIAKLQDEEEFTFFGDQHIEVYNTDEEVVALYETLLFKNDKLIFRTKLNMSPLYRVIVLLDTNEYFIKPVGGIIRKIPIIFHDF